MPVNWEAFDQEIDQAINDAAAAADKRLMERMASLTHMTEEELLQLFPEPADWKRLSKLMAIVKSSQSKNEKINHIVNNAEELGDVIVTLLDRLA